MIDTSYLFNIVIIKNLTFSNVSTIFESSNVYTVDANKINGNLGRCIYFHVKVLNLIEEVQTLCNSLFIFIMLSGGTLLCLLMYQTSRVSSQKQGPIYLCAYLGT